MGDVPRRPGRPPLDEHDPSVGLQVRLPSRVFDQVYAVAQREGCSMPDVMREALAHELQRKQHDEE
jgi:hypothetical protein